MRDVIVAGAAMTRFGKFPDQTFRSLAEEASAGALNDADASPDDVGAVYFASAIAGLITGQEMIRGQAALRNTGLLGVPFYNVENACASASTAFHLAWMAVASGAVDAALAIGAEKMTHPDKQRSFSSIGTALDLDEFVDVKAQVERTALGWHAPGAGADPSAPERSPFMDVYAKKSEDYMESSGATVDDFAQVVVKAHRHAAANPKAQYRNEVTVEDVLSSRCVSGPLTLYMCSPIGDGAAALLLCSADFAERRGFESKVVVRGCALVSGRDGGHPSVTERAAEAAYESAGIGPDELDVIEVHDAAAPAELMSYEKLGLCEPGEGPKLLANGDTALGGRVPVNPSGGLLSKGHPIGATGCGQLVELVGQLRGRCGERQVPGARIALAENGGGLIGDDSAAGVVTILATV